MTPTTPCQHNDNKVQSQDSPNHHIDFPFLLHLKFSPKVPQWIGENLFEEQPNCFIDTTESTVLCIIWT